MGVVPGLRPVAGGAGGVSSGIKATFLMTIRRRDQPPFNIGAAVDHQGRVWIVSPAEGKPLALSQVEATMYQTKIREAVQYAAIRQR